VLAAVRPTVLELPVSRLIGDAAPLTNNHSAGRAVPFGQFESGPAGVSRIHATSPGHDSPTSDTMVAQTADLPPVPLAIQRTDYYGTAPSPVVAQPRSAPVNRMPPPFIAPSPEAPTFSVAVQREDAAPAPEPVAMPDPAPAPSPPPPAASTPAPASPGTAPAPAMVPEELVKKLFDPLLRRLKTELRFDRERRGRLTDLS
jgi:pyruvate/2-oxoglutarate dehydrogenase complex dihydrolipoamide acyltransferase (E2) component